MALTNRCSNSETKKFSGLYTLLLRLSSSSLKADYFFDWLLCIDDESVSFGMSFGLLGGRYRIFDATLKADEYVYGEYFEKTSSGIKNYLGTFSAAGTEQLLLAAYEEVGHGSATEKLELILNYLNKTSVPRLRAVSDNGDMKAVEETETFKILVYRLMYTFAGNSAVDRKYEELQSWRGLKSGDQLIANSIFAIESLYRAQLGAKQPVLIPIRVYSSSGDINARALVPQILKLLELKCEYTHEPIYGSWFGRFFATSVAIKSEQELADIYEKLKRSVELQYLQKPQSESDKNIIESVAALTRAAEHDDVYVAQIGSLLFMKYPREEGGSQVFVRTLTQNELILISHNQQALMNPKEVFGLLNVQNPKTIPIEVEPEEIDCDDSKRKA